MMMESAVLCLNFSKDSSLLVAGLFFMMIGSQEGNIRIWRIEKGSLVKKLVKAHPQGISFIVFMKGNSQVLSTGFDFTLR